MHNWLRLLLIALLLLLHSSFLQTNKTLDKHIEIENWALGFAEEISYRTNPNIPRWPPFSFCGEIVPTHEEAIARRLVLALTLHSTRQTTLRLIRQRASRFFPIIEPYLARYHIPPDFKYLPLVESALNGTAISIKGAGGYWQLMPDTARELGLTVSDKADERFDLQKSTDAACRYLSMLHRRLGAWTLTAAAYNMGIGRLLTNIRRQQLRNYYYLRLNPETGRYLYRILAFKALLSPPPVPTRPDQLRPSPMPNKCEAELAEADLDELIREADEQTPSTDVETDQPAGVQLPHAAAVVLGGIQAKLTEAGRPERGQRWAFQLLGSNLTNGNTTTEGDVLYAVVEDVDRQANKVYLRADRVYSASDRRSYPLALGAIDPKSGRLGIDLSTQKTLPAGSVTTWKVL